VAGFSGDSLKTELNQIIKNHIEFPYTSSSTDVWDILKQTDRDTADSNNVLLIYSGWSVNANQEYNSGAGWSREHVWAKSRGNFGTAIGPGTDVHALRPCDVSVNSARNNRWFAECTEEYIDGDGPTGSYRSSTKWVWKPNDKVKGDVARMIFYMATRYEGEGGEPDLEIVDSIPSNSSTNLPIHAKLSDLMRWHLEDTVDDWERNRNDIIYYSFQQNRNPFIDHPEYAQMIWGNLSSLKVSIGEKKKLIKVINTMGLEADPMPNKVLIYLYSDGTVEKRGVLE
jgi:endonuclease I